VIHDHDKDFLFRLYASTREWEFRLAVWTDDEKQAFLSQQFHAQDASYRLTFPAAVHRIIKLGGIDIGRLIVDRPDDCMKIIDLSLLPEHRGRGIGTDILRSLLNEAHGGKVPVRLHVLKNNPALNLYLRHGFRKTGEVGQRYAMEWSPDLRPREI
jgi:ribosomal protein S18 acetylase RimI-like enzyme